MTDGEIDGERVMQGDPSYAENGVASRAFWGW